MKEFQIDLRHLEGDERARMHTAVVAYARVLGYRDEYDILQRELENETVCLYNNGVIASGSYAPKDRRLSMPLEDFFSLTSEDVQDPPDVVPCKFKPFDRVLIRDDPSDKWHIDFFSHYDPSDSYPYKCMNDSANYCIPYEGNESLLGTTRSPSC